MHESIPRLRVVKQCLHGAAGSRSCTKSVVNSGASYPLAQLPIAVSECCRWSGYTVAVVTGANKGIGLEIVRLFAGEGITTVLTARNESLGKKAVEEVHASLPNAKLDVCQMDITDPVSVISCAEQLKDKYKHVDILVNNAGIAYKGNIFGADEAAKTLDCNLKGTRRVCEAILPLMKEPGRIVNVCSRCVSLCHGPTAAHAVQWQYLMCIHMRRAGMLGQLSSPALKEGFMNPKDADAVEELADAFVAAIRDNTHQDKGWSNSMYGVSKLAEVSYTRWLAAQLKGKVRSSRIPRVPLRASCA